MKVTNLSNHQVAKKSFTCLEAQGRGLYLPLRAAHAAEASAVTAAAQDTASGAGKKGELPSREKVDQALTWDLSSIFANRGEFEAARDKMKALGEKAASYKGRLQESAKTLLEISSLMDEFEDWASKVSVYTYLKHDEDTANQENLANQVQISQIMVQLIAALAYFPVELSQIPQETLEAFMKEEPGLEAYRHAFDEVLRKKEHLLDQATEERLTKAAEIFGGGEAVFSTLNDSDLIFPTIKDEDGEEVELSHGRFGQFIQSKDRRVREDAFKAYYKIYDQFKNTTAKTLSLQVKTDNYMADLHGFNDAREAALFENNIPVSVYTKLLDAVHDHLPLLHRYAALRKRLLKVDELHSYDLYVPVVEDFEPKTYSIEEAQEIILEATKPLGADYTKILKTAFSERWIDYVENKGKRSGAYSSGAYSTKPFILMTWKGTLDNLYTMIHELGHSCHSYYSRANQAITYADYPIFLAEIASTTNENLLTYYLLDTVTDPKIRQHILMNYLDGFKGTVFRQSQFAEFEYLIHKADQDGQALTAEWMSQAYAELNQKFYGPALTKDPEIALEWSRIPHFYYNFYVFQYATGFSAATAFAKAIHEEGATAAERYKGMLKSGSSDYPIPTLQKAGVDMTTKKPVADAMSAFAARLDELEALLS